MSFKNRNNNDIPGQKASGLNLIPIPAVDATLSSEFVTLPGPLEVRLRSATASKLSGSNGSILLLTHISSGLPLICPVSLLIDDNVPSDRIALSKSVSMSLRNPTDRINVQPIAIESIPEATEIRVILPSEEPFSLSIEKLVFSVLTNRIISSGVFIPLLFRGETSYLKIDDIASTSSPIRSNQPIFRVTEYSKITLVSHADFLLQQQTENSLKNLSLNNNNANDNSTDKPRGFSRVGGLGSVLTELTSLVRAPLEQPELYRRMGVKPPKGVLLFGPPGTGKTLLAKALAEELSCAFEFADSASLVSRIPGETEERIRTLFKTAEEKARQSTSNACIVFIDEIDALCPKRDDSTTESEKRIVTAFLTAHALDGFTDKDQSSDISIILLGATNRPNALDEAIRRSGRLECELEVGIPSKEGRREILDILCRGIPSGLSDSEIDFVASKSHAFTGADLARLVTFAAREALAEELERRRSAVKVEKSAAENLLEANLRSAGEWEVELPKVTFQYFERGLTEIRPSGLKELAVEVPCVKWDDIGGYAEVKQRLQEMVEWPIRHAEMFKSVGIDAPKGVLLYGPPGCSKTMLARAVATESEMNFIAVKGPELFSKWVGESERAVRDLFRRARQSSPCVIFFDEVDALGVDRESGDAGGVGARVLSQMLNEMDGIGPAKQLVVIGATNRPDLLDAALMRPGRFDRLLLIPLPDFPARFEMVVNNLKKLPLDDSWFDIDEECVMKETPKTQDLKIIRGANWIARRSENYSGAELISVCKEAAMDAMRSAILRVDNHSNNTLISKDHFAIALKRVQPRIKPSLIEFYNNFESNHTHK